MKVVNELRVYEVNGSEACYTSTDVKLKVNSHPTYSSYIVIQVDNGDKYTVVAKELLAAIENATNRGGLF